MRNGWKTWALAGALLASLQWNLRSSSSAPHDTPTPANASATACSEGATCCELDLVALGITPEQTRALEEICRAQCAEADALESRAEERIAALRGLLAAQELDASALSALVAEVSSLRARSLATCVDSIVRLREVLDREQLATVVERCGPSTSCGDPAAACDR